MKPKLLVFHKALAPYRIDLFNALNEAFDTNIYFFRKNLQSQQFDMSRLRKHLNFTPKFLTKGFELHHKGRMIRFGYLQKVIRYRPDIILCLEFSIMTFEITLFTKLFFPKTKVYTICDDSVDVAQNSSTSRKIGRALSLKLLDGIILGNDPAEEWYNINFPKIETVISPIIQKEERIISIINKAQSITIDYVEEYQLQDKNVLLFVGRLVEVKNLNFLIEVFADYVLENRDAVLILVGDGNKSGELLQLVERLNIQRNVIFAGRYENEALYAWYPVADYLILPSTSETFGAVVNESLIAGVPVACSNLAGASCLIDGRNGWTFNPYNKDELLSIFRKILISKRQKNSELSIGNSLMPFTFEQRIHQLVSFLKK
jgi:glycosyltransferase involved in cell wall biosynthesis